MKLERLLAWRALIEQVSEEGTLTLTQWFDEETGSMDPLSFACTHPAFQERGLRWNTEYQVPKFYDLVGFDACSAFFELSRPHVSYILDPLSYEETSFQEVIDHIGRVINEVALQQTTTEKKETEE